MIVGFRGGSFLGGWAGGAGGAGGRRAYAGMPLLPETAFSLVCSKENRPDPRVAMANMLMQPLMMRRKSQLEYSNGILCTYHTGSERKMRGPYKNPDVTDAKVRSARRGRSVTAPARARAPSCICPRPPAGPVPGAGGALSVVCDWHSGRGASGGSGN